MIYYPVNYRKMYEIMLMASETAINAIENLNYGEAKEILIAAERDAEEIYVSAGEQETL